MHTKVPLSRTMLAVPAVSVLMATSAWTGLTLAQGRPTWPGWNVGDVAGQRIAMTDTDSASIRARTDRLLDALAIRPHAIEVTRSFDRVVQRTIDSATGFDLAGKPIVSVDWDAGDAHLRALTRYLRDVRVSASRVGRDDAVRSAERYLERAGLSGRSGDPQVSWDQGMDSWQALWMRRIAGIPAPEEAVSVWVLADGQLRALSDISSEFGSAIPSISPSDAQAAVRGLLRRTLADGSLIVGAAHLEWRHPNDFVDPALPDSPDPVLRLVYVVPYAITRSASERVEAVLWVDAATGDLAGGGAIP